jgi:hypothetical protein
VYDKGSCSGPAGVSALTLIELAVVLWNLGSGVMFSFDAMGTTRESLNRWATASWAQNGAAAAVLC